MRSVIAILLVALSAGSVEASWSAAETVVSGSWGEGDTSFGIEKGDSSDTVPEYLCVTSGNYLAVADSLNFRVKVYQDTALKKNIEYAGEEYLSDWPESLWCPGQSLLAVHGNDKSLYSVDGTFLKALADQYPVSKVKNGYIVTRSDTEYLLYNGAGELVRRAANPPLETGVVENDLVRFSDVTYRINDAAITDYEKDANGNLNIVSAADNAAQNGSHYTVCKYNRYGQQLGCLALPENDVVDAEDAAPVVNRVVHQPIVSGSGDVYAAIVSDTAYQVYRWRWIDEAAPAYVPDAPTDLKASVLPGYLRLEWDLSVQDPGCVTGYEVSRADQQGGEYRVVATVGSGVFQYEDRTTAVGSTYYYKVRTLVGTIASPFSEPVSATQTKM